MMLKADLHVHTLYSMDCNTPLDQIIKRCLEIGINCLAIADHGTIAGALKMKELAPFSRYCCRRDTYSQRRNNGYVPE